jgi:cysteine desulfurase/selenocysteine lyase
MLDERRIRADFPILAREVNGHPLVYLDSAATSQKPNQVIEAVAAFYRTSNANVHRGVHTLGDEATAAYERARERVARFIGAAPNEIVFVRNTTEAINLVAATWAAATLGPGDEIVVSSYEHHSNLVPWQRLCRDRGATLRLLPMTEAQTIPLEALERIGPKTKLVAVAHVSNAFGTIAPIAELAAAARAVGARVLLDGAQSVPHLPLDVRTLGAHFLAFSGHKMCAPMGIGVLWAKADVLETMAPFLVGGGMVREVTWEHADFAPDIARFEAGTPNVADAVGLAAAIDYLEGVGMAAIRAHEQDLVAYGLARLGELPHVQLYGPRNPDEQSGVLSFSVDGLHPHDVGTLLDRQGIAVRSGKHCCHPAMAALNVPGTVRASVYLYNSRQDIDRLVAGLEALSDRSLAPRARRGRQC